MRADVAQVHTPFRSFPMRIYMTFTNEMLVELMLMARIQRKWKKIEIALSVKFIMHCQVAKEWRHWRNEFHGAHTATIGFRMRIFRMSYAYWIFLADSRREEANFRGNILWKGCARA